MTTESKLKKAAKILTEVVGDNTITTNGMILDSGGKSVTFSYHGIEHFNLHRLINDMIATERTENE